MASRPSNIYSELFKVAILVNSNRKQASSKYVGRNHCTKKAFAIINAAVHVYSM
jgi:hypothetical protein